jgi:hypothetical protein
MKTTNKTDYTALFDLTEEESEPQFKIPTMVIQIGATLLFVCVMVLVWF